ncbi:uncharacterized protein METZ01_LOCUS279411, partial [marine metagenome]
PGKILPVSKHALQAHVFLEICLIPIVRSVGFWPIRKSFVSKKNWAPSLNFGISWI